MLVQYQKNNLEKLREAAKNNDKLLIVGSVGSGRKYVIERWCEEISNAKLIKLEPSHTSSPFSSLEEAIKKIKGIKKKSLKISPSFSISGILGSVNASLETNNLNKTEDELNNCLKKIAKHYTIVFIIDKSLDINDGSISFINAFVNKHKSKHKIYIIFVSDKKDEPVKEVYFEDFSSDNSQKIDSLKDLNLDPSINISEKVIDFIFANINNNIKLLTEIIDDLNKKVLDCNIELYDNNNRIQNLLTLANEKYAYNEQLNILMSICAISEYYFQSVDFAYLLEEHESVINLLLDYAQKQHLLNKDEDSFYIIFGIVKRIYASLDEISKRKLYIKILDMFDNIHPSEYYKKYIFAKLAETPGYNNYLIQHICSEIRLSHNIDFGKYQKELSDKEFNIISIYNKAVGYNNSKEYDKCIDELSELKELNSELLYEINLIKSQSLIKKLDTTSRDQAILLLEYDDKIKDENLKFRLNIRKIAALVHIGQYARALNSCEQTMAYLLDKLKITHATEYEYYLNVIYRKFSYVSPYDTSINEVKQSVEFFKKNQDAYHKGYYIALVNLLSLYIINMKLLEAAETIQELEDLLITKNNFSFPRKEIMENNVILYDFFADNIDSKKACDDFKNLYDKTKNSADNVLIASNYAIFLMFNNEFAVAERVLLDEIPDTSCDLEGIYDTRVKINLAICKFLMNNSERENCIKILESVEYNKQAPYYKVRSEELNNIKTLMNNIEQCNDANEWCEAFKANISTPFTSYTTYQQGFVYTTLFNWDDD